MTLEGNFPFRNFDLGSITCQYTHKALRAGLECQLWSSLFRKNHGVIRSQIRGRDFGHSPLTIGKTFSSYGCHHHEFKKKSFRHTAMSADFLKLSLPTSVASWTQLFQKQMFKTVRNTRFIPHTETLKQKLEQGCDKFVKVNATCRGFISTSESE